MPSHASGFQKVWDVNELSEHRPNLQSPTELDKAEDPITGALSKILGLKIRMRFRCTHFPMTDFNVHLPTKILPMPYCVQPQKLFF